MAFAKFYENDETYTAPWLNPYLTQQIKHRNQEKKLGIIKGSIKEQSWKNADSNVLGGILEISGNRSNATYSKSSKIEGTSDELQYSSAISCSSFEDVIEESESQLSCNNSEESIKPGETEQIVDFYFQSKTEPQIAVLTEPNLDVKLKSPSSPPTHKSEGTKCQSNINQLKLWITTLVEEVKSNLQHTPPRRYICEENFLDDNIYHSNQNSRARMRRRVRNCKINIRKDTNREGCIGAQAIKCCEDCTSYQECIKGILKFSKETVDTIEVLLNSKKFNSLKVKDK